MTRQRLSPPVAAFKRIIAAGLDEDAADRDRTSACLPASLRCKGVVVAKEPGVIAGLDALRAFAPAATVTRLVRDGDRLRRGQIVARLSGPARIILSRERVALNLLGRLSGIATLTRMYAARISTRSKTKLLDTRKTTPGLRSLEKYAVRCGGGVNHRSDLAGWVFIKDNHLAAAGLAPFHPARRGKAYTIVEADSLAMVRRVLEILPDRILLDNMTDREVVAAIRVIRASRGKIEIEVSGGITPERVSSLSKLGVDFISVGALTHAARSMNFSLDLLA